ncbi:aspartate/glutamate racemase family protein [Hydrogenophaga sp. NFH-34]|uniref:aspartate/glutamate racemase family protein n=1 Tax=Hydrogenophaga sp. NFH-34 TaxID=2744446 RepID=UPI001F48E378|nr:aspartate/glutamate racemase family protein [Hydrogenophaga sp. NFH-34]
MAPAAHTPPGRRLLLVNPNTSATITERLALSARPHLPAGTTLTALTATEGPAAVRSPDQLAAAGARVLAMAQAHQADHDAVIVGISLDCGLAATRAALAPRPVLGMTEAACLMASLSGPRFALLTLGAAMADSYRDHVQALGFGPRLLGVAAPEAPEAFGAPAAAVLPPVLDTLTEAVRPLCAAGAHSVVLAGAVLCGYAPALSERLGLPVFDGVACATRLVHTHWALTAGQPASSPACA